MLKYYVLEKTQECRDFFFNNECIFNLWNEYLILHLNEFDNCHRVLANRTGKKFHSRIFSETENALLKKRLREEFCQTSECAVQENIPVTKYYAPLLCDLTKEWGSVVCQLTQNCLCGRSY